MPHGFTRAVIMVLMKSSPYINSGYKLYLFKILFKSVKPFQCDGKTNVQRNFRSHNIS